MPRYLHAIYLSVIGILVAVIGGLIVHNPDRGKHDPNLIAVLPFVPIEADQSTTQVTDNVTDKLLNALGKESQAIVVARSKIVLLIERKLDIAAIGDALQVSRVLEGSVKVVDENVRIAVQLIDVTSEEHLWYSNYDREVGDLDSAIADIVTNVMKFSNGSR